MFPMVNDFDKFILYYYFDRFAHSGPSIYIYIYIYIYNINRQCFSMFQFE